MKRSAHAPAVTSLPQSPQDEATHRVRRYALTMGIRTVCFLAIALVQPFGWWTWVFAAGAIFLPYIAVVYANAGSDSTASTVESPELQLEAPVPAQPAPQSDHDVFTIHERTAAEPVVQPEGDTATDDDEPRDDAR